MNTYLSFIKIFFLLSFIAIDISVKAQSPAIQWTRSLGGSNDEFPGDLQLTKDGGYIITGATKSTDGDVTGYHYGASTYDIWVVKLDSIGKISWERAFGGTGEERYYGKNIRQTTDGGYIFSGTTWSNNGDILGNHGGADIWVVKLDNLGNISWQKCYGGPGRETSAGIQQTIDGGYIIAGTADYVGGDVTAVKGGYDYWVIKLNDTGKIVWQKCYGGTGIERASGVIQTADRGYVVTGSSQSTDGDVTGLHGLNDDIWLVKLNDTGKLMWQRCYGSLNLDWCNDICEAPDGNFVMTGSVGGGKTGDVTDSFGSNDLWILKVNKEGGAIIWQKTYGSHSADEGASIKNTKDGGYIVSGYAGWGDGTVIGYHDSGGYGNTDAWVIKLNDSGVIKWQKCLGGPYTENSACTQQLADSSYIVLAYNTGNGGEVTGSHSYGYGDLWLVKLGRDSVSTVPGYVNTTTLNGIKVYPNFTNGQVKIELPGNIDNVRLSLFNSLGEVIPFKREKSIAGYNIQLQNLSSGSYFLRIESNGGSATYKIVYKQ